MKFNARMVIFGLLICVCIAVTALVVNKDSEFSGSDDAASNVISEILEVEEYEPWTSPIYEPPGGETESLLFCLQAALGAGVFGYGIGVLVERKRKSENKSSRN
ncbi:Cobalt transport protein CbiN [Clostridiales bacterium CHKCI001]|nr:Cobalt transport protein CbiN [Clostridiales bacterium CHKCI001]